MEDSEIFLREMVNKYYGEVKSIQKIGLFASMAITMV